VSRGRYGCSVTLPLIAVLALVMVVAAYLGWLVSRWPPATASCGTRRITC
jgi:hypothetical protein